MVLTLAMVAAGCGGSKSETTPTEKWAGDLCSAVGTWRTSITSIASSVQTNGVTKDSLTNALERAKSDTKKLTDDLKGLGRPNTQAGKVRPSVHGPWSRSANRHPRRRGAPGRGCDKRPHCLGSVPALYCGRPGSRLQGADRKLLLSGASIPLAIPA